MKLTSLLIAVSTVGTVWSQSLDEAAGYFERYEYARAAQIYSEYAKSNPLPLEDYKRLTYSYFVIGEFESCLPLSDSICKLPKTEPLFYYINGEVNMGNRNYEKAKESYVKYESMDSEYPVAVKIQSCDLIPTWNQEVHLTNTLFPNNSTKANITGPSYLDGELYYAEIGKDSLGENMDHHNIDNSELVLSRPFASVEGMNDQLLIDTDLKDVSVPSVAISPDKSKVWLTISQPLAEEQMDMVPHLYVGDYDASTHSISNVQIWDYSGYEDSTSCAHATINASGDMIVFTKMGEHTMGADLYKTNLIDGQWSKPKSIKGLNTEMDEMYPMFMGDSLLSFASDGRPGYGGLDIFIAEVENGSFGNIKHLKSPVNSFKDDFNFHYYSIDSARYTSNREGGMGDDDMYFVKFSNPVKEPIADSSDFFDFINDWETPVVYFDFDKFNLGENVDKLDDLIAFLSNYPKSSLTIEGHTDRRGSIDYNFNLGYKRAQSVKEELVSKGVSAGQISITSKGATAPQVKCDSCTEAMHAKNRVALIKLNAK